MIYKMTIPNNRVAHLSTPLVCRSVIHTWVVAHLKIVGLVKQQQNLSRSQKESDSDSTRGEFMSRQ